MRNISERIKVFLSKLSGFLALTIVARQVPDGFFELGGEEEKISTPYISPNFGYRELKI